MDYAAKRRLDLIAAKKRLRDRRIADGLVRLDFYVPKEVIDRIKDIQASRKIKTRANAALDLLIRGLELVEAGKDEGHGVSMTAAI
jgi:rRNA-processing protein FCF1